MEPCFHRLEPQFHADAIDRCPPGAAQMGLGKVTDPCCDADIRAFDEPSSPTNPMSPYLHLFIVPAGLAFLTAAGQAATVSVNTGSLGAAANGTNTDNLVLGQPGALSAPGDLSNTYAGGERTTVPFLAALNPAASSPFSIEFWAKPTAWDNDDAVVSNRQASGNRSGWTFFQRDASVGWNFRMYNGNGGALGWDLTGGTANLNQWSHVVAIWDGAAAQLYVNGVLADSSNDSGSGLFTYNPNTSLTSPTLNVGANFDGGSPFTGSIDEVALYPTALTSGQIANHFALASSPVPGAYGNAVRADGALLQLQNVPEPTTATLGALAVLGLGRGRRRRS